MRLPGGGGHGTGLRFRVLEHWRGQAFQGRAQHELKAWRGENVRCIRETAASLVG